MRIPVVLEPLAGGKRYRARSSEPFAVTVEADTRDEALGQVTREIEAQMRSREVVYLDVPTARSTVLEAEVIDENDPRMVEYRECLAEVRRELEAAYSLRSTGAEEA